MTKTGRLRRLLMRAYQGDKQRIHYEFMYPAGHLRRYRSKSVKYIRVRKVSNIKTWIYYHKCGIKNQLPPFYHVIRAYKLTKGQTRRKKEWDAEAEKMDIAADQYAAGNK